MKKITTLLTLIILAGMSAIGQTVKVWKIEKVFHADSVTPSETSLYIYVEVSSKEFSYPQIDIQNSETGQMIYSTGLTYYQHPGNDAEYFIKIPNQLLKTKNYNIIFSRSLTRFDEITDFIISDKRTKKKLKKASKK
jgi:hypothetical protein